MARRVTRRLWEAVEHQFGEPMGVLLTDMLLSERMTQSEVATLLGVSRPTISVWWAVVRANAETATKATAA